MKEKGIAQFESNKSMKEIKLILSKLNRENDYSDHLFGSLEFTFDKIF